MMIQYVVLLDEHGGKHHPVNAEYVNGDGRKTLIVNVEMPDGGVRGRIVRKAGPHVRGRETHFGNCWVKNREDRRARLLKMNKVELQNLASSHGIRYTDTDRARTPLRKPKLVELILDLEHPKPPPPKQGNLYE